MQDPLNILILCTGNSARSILGEAAFNLMGQGRVRAFSAGSRPVGAPNPFAMGLLARRGIDTGFARSKSWDEFAGEGAPRMDIVITVCDSAAAEDCPYWPGAPVRAHWGLPDPASAPGTAADKAMAFEATWAALEQRIAAFLALPLAQMGTGDLAAQLARIGAGAS